MTQIAVNVRPVTGFINVLENEAILLWHISSLTLISEPLGFDTRPLARWCNGSTADSGSVCHGSNPCRAAKISFLDQCPWFSVDQLLRGELLLLAQIQGNRIKVMAKLSCVAISTFS